MKKLLRYFCRLRMSHGPLGLEVDDVNLHNAVHYCSLCGATGTYRELRNGRWNQSRYGRRHA